MHQVVSGPGQPRWCALQCMVKLCALRAREQCRIMPSSAAASCARSSSPPRRAARTHGFDMTNRRTVVSAPNHAPCSRCVLWQGRLPQRLAAACVAKRL